MSVLRRFLVIFPLFVTTFLLGWAGAVLTYSDLIYPKDRTPFTGSLSEQGVLLDEETGKPLIQTEDFSPLKETEDIKPPELIYELEEPFMDKRKEKKRMNND